MKKPLILLITLIISFCELSAQKNRNVLLLKNGSSIYGKLLEASDSIYKMRTPEGSIFIFPSAEVDKYLNEASRYEGRKRSGASFAIEGGILIGSQSSDYKTPFSFNLSGGYILNARNTFSLGTGVEYLGQPFTPLYFEYKYLISEKKTAPFLFIRGGRLLHLKGDDQSSDLYLPPTSSPSYKGGGSFTTGIGISWASDDYETYLSFAYRYAHTSYTETNTYSNQTTTYKNAYNRLEIKLGFRF